jgi:hypothetical protein
MHRLKLATKLAEDTKEDQIFHGMASRYSPDPAKKYILSSPNRHNSGFEGILYGYHH